MWCDGQAWYTSTDPLHSALSISTGLSVLSFIIGELTLNGSTVDRMWAALPWLYSAHFAFHGRLSGVSGFAKAVTPKHLAADPISNLFLKICPAGVNPRMFLVFLLYTVWSARLTGNTIRRGFFDFTSEVSHAHLLRSPMLKAGPFHAGLSLADRP